MTGYRNSKERQEQVTSSDSRTTPRRLTIYGDFNCPYSYLASLRVNDLLDRGLVEVEWRAVEHDRRLSMMGTPTGPQLAEWQQEIGEVAGLALDGEQPPSSVPSLLSNTKAAVSAYAEAVTDGLERTMRDQLFDAIWVKDLNISSANEVRRIVTDLMYPAVHFPTLRQTETATPVCHDWDGDRITRRTGGTIAPDGGPLTSTGYWRIREWREQWLALPAQVVPTLVEADGAVHSGAEALTRLGELSHVHGDATTAPVTLGRTFGRDVPTPDQRSRVMDERPAA